MNQSNSFFNQQVPVDGNQSGSNFVSHNGVAQAIPYYPWQWTPWGSNPYQWMPPFPPGNQWWPDRYTTGAVRHSVPVTVPLPHPPSNTHRITPLDEVDGQRNEKQMSDGLSAVEPNHDHSQSPPVAHTDQPKQMFAERNEKQKSDNLSSSEK